MSEEFGKAFWEDRYRTHTAVCRRRPNPQLVAEAGDLAPGTALDAGCGEGTDAIWLASRGWQVTAVDIATTALRRAREHADTLDADITSRIDWVPADLTSWTPPRNTSIWSSPTTCTRLHCARRCCAGWRHRSRRAARCSSSATTHQIRTPPPRTPWRQRCSSQPRRSRPASTPTGGTSPSPRPGTDRPPSPTATRSPSATPSFEPASTDDLRMSSCIYRDRLAAGWSVWRDVGLIFGQGRGWSWAGTDASTAATMLLCAVALLTPRPASEPVPSSSSSSASRMCSVPM